MRMLISSQAFAFIILCLGVAFFFVSDVPNYANVIFAALCVGYSVWTFLTVFRDRDELKWAGVRYALASASSVGVPLSLAFVMMMILLPGLQNAVSAIATLSDGGMPPSSVGFGLGVVFAMLVMSAVFAISHSIWWWTKR